MFGFLKCKYLIQTNRPNYTDNCFKPGYKIGPLILTDILYGISKWLFLIYVKVTCLSIKQIIIVPKIVPKTC